MLDIGAQLRETRMRRRIDISEVEAATKIRAKYLRALENEEWSLLPGPTFVKTFLRTYAEYLGLDARSLVEEYRQRYETPATSELTPLRPRGSLGGRPPRRRRPALGPWVLVAGVLVALVAALYGLGKLGDNGDETPSTNTVQRATPTPTPKPAKSKKRTRHTAAASSHVLRVQIQATGTVWVCMENAAGTPVVDQRTMQSGDRTRTFRSTRFRVSFGNGSARLRVNGKSVQVPSRSDPVGYDLRAGRKPRELPSGQRPTCA
jgi:cytoskeleton protein RodZ